MKTPLFASLLLSGLLLVGSPARTLAQSQSSGAIPWFTVQNKALVVQTGTKVKPLDKDVTLPNGIRVEYRTQSVLLTNGTRVPLREGDMLSLNGEFIKKTTDSTPVAAVVATPAAVVAPAPQPALMASAAQPAAPAPAPVAAPAAAPVAAPMAAAPAAFSYRPAAPVNGKLKGVVELGASGFNMFIIRMDAQRNWKLEKSEFGNSLVMENMATDEDIRTGLKAYIGKMLDFGVSGRDIHFVVSSGAAMADVTRRIVKSLESLKYVVNTVTAEREGVLGLRAALPPTYTDKAFLVDMGSANTKISWIENGQAKSVSSYGAKYYEKGLADAAVAADVASKAALVPAALRGTCFIIGGVPYELAKAVRQGQEPYTVLRSADGYPQLEGAKVKAGLNIYRTVAATTTCPQFVFGYDTNFTIGYLLTLP